MGIWHYFSNWIITQAVREPRVPTPSFSLITAKAGGCSIDGNGSWKLSSPQIPSPHIRPSSGTSRTVENNPNCHFVQSCSFNYSNLSTVSTINEIAKMKVESNLIHRRKERKAYRGGGDVCSYSKSYIIAGLEKVLRNSSFI